MDIRQWLEHTADREPPDPSDGIGIPGKFREDRPVPDQATRSYRHKRKHAASDSSIIVPQEPSDRRKAEARVRYSSPDHVQQTQDVAGALHDRQSSDNLQSRSESAPAKTYERRARHKTRTDRYDPKAKKQKKEARKRKDGNSHQKRRKSQRIGDDARTTGLVQSFQLKNGPKNKRLTLKPDTNAGLFKHGRASMQMAGRVSGLPDLVFNEMRFLQKPTEHQDEVRGVHESRKSKTKEPGRDQGQEISAYFNAKTSIVPEARYEERVRQAPMETGKDRRSRGRRAKEADLSKPLVELPEKPFLGFGSKGVQPLSATGHDDSTSYYTWSESAQRRLSPRREHQVTALTYNTGQDLAQNPPGNRRQVSGKHARNPSKDGGTTVGKYAADIKHGEWIPTGRACEPAAIEVYQPPHPSKRVRSRSTSVTKTTSQSLPKHPSSPTLFNKRTVENSVTKARESSSYHTSDILNVHGQSMNYVHTSYPPHVSEQITHDKENHEPQSSLSIDKVIKRARAAAQTPHVHPQPPPPLPLKEIEINRLPNIRRMPSINDLSRQNQLNNAPPPRSLGTMNSPRSNQARWLPATMHRPLSKAERQHWETAAVEALAYTAPRLDVAQQPKYVNENDERLDDIADDEVLRSVNDNELEYRNHEADALYHQHFRPRSSIFEAQLHATADHFPGPPSWYESQVGSRSGPIRGISIENEVYGERSREQQDSPVDDGLAGFWKPNILY